jgi:hypothetical protein
MGMPPLLMRHQGSFVIVLPPLRARDPRTSALRNGSRPSHSTSPIMGEFLVASSSPQQSHSLFMLSPCSRNQKLPTRSHYSYLSGGGNRDNSRLHSRGCRDSTVRSCCCIVGRSCSRLAEPGVSSGDTFKVSLGLFLFGCFHVTHLSGCMDVLV